MVDGRYFTHTEAKRRNQRYKGVSGGNFYPQKEVIKKEKSIKDTPSNQTLKTSSRLRHSMSIWEKVQFVLIRTLGNFLLLISLYGVGATFGPVLSYELQFRVAQARGVRYVVMDPTPTPSNPSKAPISSEVTPTPMPVSPGFGAAILGAKEQVIIPPDTKFSIVIPKLGATSRVIPNVDPTNEASFTNELTKGVAHARGTVFPGMEGNVYLFAHSTDTFWNVGRYNAVFYLIKDLVPGDEIIIYFEGRRYTYVVERSEIKDAEDVEYLVQSQQLKGQNLILQTCWPPGTTWKRLYVIARPK